ncbi:MAG: pilus assembly protein TadG-related protein [Chloroflexota bacterium]
MWFARIKRRLEQEQGQVLIIFALGSLVFLGMLVLAVDVGTMYVDRRDAQSTADAAALVGAQERSGYSIASAAAIYAARDYANRNGYNTTLTAGNGVWSGDVMVSTPPSSGPYAGNNSCIEVVIRKTRNSFFGGLLGADNLQVSARAVARTFNEGLQVAVLGLKEHDDSVTNGGSAVTVIGGSTYSRGRTKAQGSGGLFVSGKAYAREGCTGGSLHPADACVDDPPDVFDPKWSAPSADPGPGGNWRSNGAAEQATKDGDGYLHIQPGTYDYISISPSDKVIFEPGVYRITKSQGVKNNGSMRGSGVCFVMDAGTDFSSESQAEVFLQGSSDYNNIVVWSADTGNKAIKIAGGANTNIKGTLYAPRGGIELDGNTSGLVEGQVVGYTVKLGGTSDTSIKYVESNASTIMTPCLVE